VSVDWDRELLAAKLVDADSQIRDLERTAAWLRGLLEPAERAHAAHLQELARLDGQMLAMHRSCGRIATEDQLRAYAALENRHAGEQDRFRAWAWAPSATVAERARAGNPRTWSTRWADDVRTRLVATTVALQLADAERDRLLAEIQALDAQPAEVDVPGSRPWLSRMLGT
jgi:hypothetical protein